MKKIAGKIKSSFWKAMRKIMREQLRREHTIGYMNECDDGVGNVVIKLCERIPSLPRYKVDHNGRFVSPSTGEPLDSSAEALDELISYLDSSEEAFNELVAYIVNLLE